MQIYSDMLFSGSPQAMQTLLNQLDSMPSLGAWTRDTEAERSVQSLLDPEEVVRSYRSEVSDDLAEAHLWLSITACEWRVTNIVPGGQDQISPANYTQMLATFRSAALPYAEAVGVNITQPVADVGPEHFLSQQAAQLLHQFSVLANKSTGASHPRDLARWNAFVIAVHRDSCKIGATELVQLLIENEQWPEAKAAELGLLFEYETSLLHALD